MSARQWLDGCVAAAAVGQLRDLIQLVETHRELQSGLQRALGLKKDQWTAMREHLGKAVVQRPLLRAWFPPDGSPLGLLFGPHNGESGAFNPWGARTHLLRSIGAALPVNPHHEPISGLMLALLNI